MEKVKKIRHGRHCVFLLHAHLVFVTKYRYGVFTKPILNDLREIVTSVCSDFDAELVEFDGEDDYIHLLVTYPPKILSSLVNSLKGVSSRLIRKKGYPSIQKISGAILFGRQAILQEVAAVLQFLFYANISNRKGHQTNVKKIPVKVHLLSSPLKGEVLRRGLIK